MISRKTKRKVSSFDLYSVFACREGWCIVDGLFNCWGHLIVVGYNIISTQRRLFGCSFDQYGTIDAHASYPINYGCQSDEECHCDLRSSFLAVHQAISIFQSHREILTSNASISKDLRTFNISSLDFRYNNANSDVLKSINIDLFAGQAVGLVGRSGAGKSTLIDLLTRLYRSKTGEYCSMVLISVI